MECLERRKTMKISTINVVVVNDDNVSPIYAFSDDNDGQVEAEKKFATIIRTFNPDLSEPEISEFLFDKYYEQGTAQVFILQSVN